jgi:sugar-specific transcriptional regulator TrmB
MTSSETQENPFDVLLSFLIEAGKLNEIDAKIYVLGLKKGIITSGEVVKERILSRQTTVGDRLRRLANDGYFERTLDEPKLRGKGHARKYKAIPPEVALSSFLEKYQGIHDCIEKIKESRELQSETTELENEIWLIRPQKVAMSRVAAFIRSARQSVKIFSHDCSWFQISEIKDSLQIIASNKVPVQIFATKADEKIDKALKKIGIHLLKTAATYIPFCLIDDSLLLLSCLGGLLSNEYFVISTKQKYLVNNFAETFNSISDWSKKESR